MSDLAPQRCDLALPGGNLSFLEWKQEDGLPPLHFAHANGFNAQTYSTLLAPLASAFHIRAWDARGHGRSTLPTEPSRLQDWGLMRDDLIAALENFSAVAAQPVWLGGHSFGATIGLLAAALRPELVRGILLVEPVMMPFYVRWSARLSRMLGNHFFRTALIESARRRRAVFPSREEMLERYKGRGAFRTWPDEVIKDYIEGGTRLREDGSVELTCDPEWEAAIFRAQGHNPYRALRQYQGPLSLLYAGQNSTCWPPAPARISARGGDTRVKRVEEATHFLPMEMPDLVRRELAAFSGVQI